MVDGGTSEVLESIDIPSIAHAPFYATLDTEWERPLAGGGSYTFQNERHIARDGAGRVYEERWYLVPKNGKIQTKMYYTQIFDSVAHVGYSCGVEEKVCTLRSYDPVAEVDFTAATDARGVLPDGWGFVTHEDLGKQTVAGLETTGMRETDTINPWMAGNDRPMRHCARILALGRAEHEPAVYADRSANRHAEIYDLGDKHVGAGRPVVSASGGIQGSGPAQLCAADAVEVTTSKTERGRPIKQQIAQLEKVVPADAAK